MTTWGSYLPPGYFVPPTPEEHADELLRRIEQIYGPHLRTQNYMLVKMPRPVREE